MSTAPFSASRRRALLLGAAVVLLHWLALHWLGAQITAPRERLFDRQPPAVLARLLAAEPVAAPAPPTPPAPGRKPAPRPRPRPAAPEAGPEAAPPEVSVAVATAAEEGPADAAPADAAPADDAPAVAMAPGADQAGSAAQGGAADAPAGVQSAGQPGPPAAGGSAPSAARRYRVDLPPPADIMLDVARTDADGTRWSGEALLSFRRGAGRYRVQVEAGIRVVFARVNLVVLTSEGAVDDAGLAPVTMTEKRRGRALTATHFNRDGGTITFSASGNAYPLAGGAQDKASVPLQLAGIARADPGQLSGDIEIQVGEDRDASVYRFVVLGQEQIDTRMGRLQTWHLSRPPRPGSYSSRLDIWLAPGRGWYPVQIRNTEASGAVTTQTVNNIVMTDTGS
jgi:hypothetical protein